MAIRKLFNQELDRVALVGGPSSRSVPANVERPHAAVILPGSFNPLHRGHLRMAALAERRLQARVEFELSIRNVDKPSLSPDESLRRVEQFTATQTVWLTRAATFHEKVQLFPGAVFVIGADTLIRIADPEYYSNGAGGVRETVEIVRGQGCRFLVFGRSIHADSGGADALADLPASAMAFCELDKLCLPDSLRSLCDAVPESEFREDISSRQLRGKPSGGLP